MILWISLFVNIVLILVLIKAAYSFNSLLETKKDEISEDMLIMWHEHQSKIREMKDEHLMLEGKYRELIATNAWNERWKDTFKEQRNDAISEKEFLKNEVDSLNQIIKAKEEDSKKKPVRSTRKKTVKKSK